MTIETGHGGMVDRPVEAVGDATEPGTLSRRMLLRRLGVVSAAAGAYVLLPGIGRASPPVTATDIVNGLPGTAGGSDAVQTPIPFSMVGFELSGDAGIEFRTSPDGQAWTPWTVPHRMGADGEGPDAGSGEDSVPWRRMTHPVWVGEARWLQVRGADPREVRAHLVDSADLSRSSFASAATTALDALVGAPTAAHAAPSQPNIVSRAGWGADESWRSGSPRYASSARFAVIHHTATGNGYSKDDVPAIMRGMYRYHTQTLGWADLGYNFVVDKFGRVFEGRYGGIDKAVIGAHAAGYNTGSIGVAAIGNYQVSSGEVWASMLEGFDRVVAWKFAHHGIDPYGTTQEGSRTLPTIIGHRDVGSTSCPGDRFYRYVRGSEPMAERVWLRMYGFRDVPLDSQFARDIAWVSSMGITRGVNPPKNDLFDPKGLVTREQMAAFLTRGLGLTDADHPGFRDVKSGSTFDQDIRRIAKAGITRGANPPTNDLFRPKDVVSREQMAAFLTRGLGLTDDDHPGFRDVPKGSTFDQDIRRLAKAGITRGSNPPKNDLFNPKGSVSREHMAAFLRRALT